MEQDTGYISVSSSPILYFAEYKDWPPYEKEAISRAHGKVLDIGCGVGSHSLYLQSRGHEVMGIDISSVAVEVGKSRGLRKARVVSVDDLRLEGEFETVLMLDANLGLQGNPGKAKQILRRLHELGHHNYRNDPRPQYLE